MVNFPGKLSILYDVSRFFCPELVDNLNGNGQLNVLNLTCMNRYGDKNRHIFLTKLVNISD